MSLYNRTPNKVGGGFKTNSNGLSFEGRTSLIESLDKHEDIEIKQIGNEYQVFFKNKLFGIYTEKHSFYSTFLEKKNVDWKQLVSKKYLPDSVFINLMNNTVYIIEKKFQEGSGSVDEKLQTCDFKKKIYTRLIEKTEFRTEYYYLWNTWFTKDEYKDVKEYIHSVGCKFFIETIELEELGIQ
jgi:hypothetical protein